MLRRLFTALCALLAPSLAWATDQGRFIEFAAVPTTHIAPPHVVVWLPPGYDTSKHRYGVVYMHDGQNLFFAARSNFNKVWAADKAALTLIAAHKVAPFIIVGIDQPGKDRARYYLPRAVYDRVSPDTQAKLDAFQSGPNLSDAYLDFIVHDLKPMIDTRFRTRPDRAHTTIVGSSMGGLISLYAIARFPDIFGQAGCVSTHLPLGDPTTLGAVNQNVIAAWGEFVRADLGAPQGRRIWFDHGDQTLDALYPPYQQALDADLIAAGWSADRDFVSKAYPGAAHEENAWAQRLPEIFAWLQSRKSWRES